MTTDAILVRRLLRHYNPWWNLGLPSYACRRIALSSPRVTQHRDYRHRTRLYHYGRIRHFMHLIESGAALTPIEIDNEWCGRCVLGPKVLDGNHRLIAAALVRAPTIASNYGGSVELLEWLKGERKSWRCP